MNDSFDTGDGHLVIYRSNNHFMYRDKLVALTTKDVNNPLQTGNNVGGDATTENNVRGQDLERTTCYPPEYTLPYLEQIKGCQLDKEGCVLLMSDSVGSDYIVTVLKPGSLEHAKDIIEIEQNDEEWVQVRHIYIYQLFYLYW